MANNTKSNAKTEEQIHYESLSSFLKYCISFAGSVITLIIAFGAWMLHKDTSDMKKDFKESIADMRIQMAEFKNEASKTTTEISANAIESAQKIEKENKEAILSTKTYSETEISRISASTNQIALEETKKQLDYIFGTDKIQNLIQHQAVKEIKSKVVEIVADETQNLSVISDAGSEMRIGRYAGMTRLKSFFLNSRNAIDSLTAKRLYDKISLDYFSTVDTTEYGSNFNDEDLVNIQNNKLPKTIEGREQLKSTIASINNTSEFETSSEPLSNIATYIYRLGIISKQHFMPFDTEGVNEWYKNLKEQ